jgi:hypothetical protein
LQPSTTYPEHICFFFSISRPMAAIPLKDPTSDPRAKALLTELGFSPGICPWCPPLAFQERNDELVKHLWNKHHLRVNTWRLPPGYLVCHGCKQLVGKGNPSSVKSTLSKHRNRHDVCREYYKQKNDPTCRGCLRNDAAPYSGYCER